VIENQHIVNYFRENAKNIWSVSEMFVLLQSLSRRTTEGKGFIRRRMMKWNGNEIEKAAMRVGADS